MDKKKKIVALIGMVIGAVFLILGFKGMYDKAASKGVTMEEAAAAVEAETANTVSADPLDNIR